jgi:hypothetical protein
MKKNMMDEACGKQGKKRGAYRILVERAERKIPR